MHGWSVFAGGAMLSLLSAALVAQEVNVTKCLSIQDTDKRKECFADAYSQTSQSASDTRPGKAPELPPGWTETQSQDHLRGNRSFYVLTPEIAPSRAMQFPYHDTTMQLAIGCDGNREWAYFVFSNQPNIVGGEIGDGYSAVDVEIRWGYEVTRHRLTQDLGSRFLMFMDSEDVIRRVEANPKMVAEFSWYGEGRVQFASQLDGGAGAIDYLRQKCKGI